MCEGVCVKRARLSHDKTGSHREALLRMVKESAKGESER